MRISRPFFFFLFCFACYHSTQAQTATTSPYSRYGIGDIQMNQFIRNAGMGGLSLAVREDSVYPNYLNISNPASYTSFDYTVFEAGIKSDFTWRSTTDQTVQDRNIALSYFGFGFPIKDWWGASFGLRPYSNVGYEISDQGTVMNDTNQTAVSYLYSGQGGLNQFYIGNGFKPHKNLSIGFNASFLFGTLDRTRRVEFKDGDYFNFKLTNSTDFSDFHFSYGAQYHLPFKDGKSLNFGAVFANNTKLKATRSSLGQTYDVANNFEIIKDTVLNESTGFRDVVLPRSYGGGITYQDANKWVIGVDYRQQDWSEYESFGETDNLADSWRASIGAEFVPDHMAVARGDFFKRMNYRLGGYYSSTYLQLRNTQLTDYGITFGFGIPVYTRGIRSIVNFAVEAGQRGTTDNNLIQEQYINLKFGFTFNDRWFIKRKYD